MEYTFAYENESQWTFAVPLDTATTATITTTTIQETKQRNAARDCVVAVKWRRNLSAQWEPQTEPKTEAEPEPPSPNKAKWGCSRRQISIQIVIKLTAKFKVANGQSCARFRCDTEAFIHAPENRSGDFRHATFATDPIPIAPQTLKMK